MAFKRNRDSMENLDKKRQKQLPFESFINVQNTKDTPKVTKSGPTKHENCTSKYFETKEPTMVNESNSVVKHDGSSIKNTDFDTNTTGITPNTHLDWKKITSDKLDLDYCHFLPKLEADKLFAECERILEYNTGQLAKVHVYGKWHDIPRKQVAFGDEGLSYTFSNNTVPAKPWLPILDDIRQKISKATSHKFNFVLINRYKDGNDYIGEHRDDEKDLMPGSPIASLSLGQKRDFLFKHGDSRGKHARCNVPSVKLELEHGSLLMMNYPTNEHWYHSLPVRKKVTGVRINMTFREMKA